MTLRDRLGNEHAATVESRDGRAVLVVEGVEAGSFEVKLAGYQLVEATSEEHEALSRLGIVFAPTAHRLKLRKREGGWVDSQLLDDDPRRIVEGETMWNLCPATFPSFKHRYTAYRSGPEAICLLVACGFAFGPWEGEL